MTARACRWCGRQLSPREGRPPAWCAPGCRDAYVRALGTSRHDGPVELVERCGVEGCGLDGATTPLAGPVIAPGRWLTATARIAEALHGHAVEVEAVAASSAVGSVALPPPPTLTGARRVG